MSVGSVTETDPALKVSVEQGNAFIVIHELPESAESYLECVRGLIVPVHEIYADAYGVCKWAVAQRARNIANRTPDMTRARYLSSAACLLRLGEMRIPHESATMLDISQYPDIVREMIRT